MIHSQKVAFIEGCPAGWPEGWAFGPGRPIPPGWETREYPDVVLAASAMGSDPTSFEVYTLDRYAEDTDILLGQVLMVRAYDGRRKVRMRLGNAEPWSEELWIKISEYEPGKFGVRRNIQLDRAHLPFSDVKIVATVYASTLDVEVNA